MRIAVDLTPAIQKHAGLGRYAEELTRALVALKTDNALSVFYTDPERRVPAPPLDALPRRALDWSNKPWRMAVLLATLAHVPMDSLIGEQDLFHATDHLLPSLKHGKTVFTIHDLIFRLYPEYHLLLNRWFLATAMPHFLRRADAVIAVSECTRRDAIRLYDVPPDKITVVYEGVNPALHPENDPDRIAAVRARYAHDCPFVLFVSTIEPRKNIPALVDAVRLLHDKGLPHRLVVSGRKGWLYEGLFEHVKKTGMESLVEFCYIPDEDLPATFAACDVFAFPSLYEGFGLPPLEAMACGAPVVCSNTSSLPEVVGDAALLVNPQDVKDLAAAVERVITDDSLRGELRARGVQQAAKFSWARAARETLAVYEKVSG